MGYAQARRDFEFLETIDELEDQVELDARRENLMQNPTKAAAADMYVAAIESWFGAHVVEDAPAANRRRVKSIKARHCLNVT